MSSKIRVQFGAVEVEYEGSDEFLKEGLLDLIQSIADMQEAMRPTIGTVDAVSPNQGNGESTLSVAETQFQGSINTIATKLGVDSGPDLILATMAHFTFVQGKDTIDRKEIIREMKGATMYYKPSYISNLSAALAGLVKSGAVNEIRSGVYALAAGTRTRFEERLK